MPTHPKPFLACSPPDTLTAKSNQQLLTVCREPLGPGGQKNGRRHATREEQCHAVCGCTRSPAGLSESLSQNGTTPSNQSQDSTRTTLNQCGTGAAWDWHGWRNGEVFTTAGQRFHNAAAGRDPRPPYRQRPPAPLIILNQSRATDR